MIFVTIGTQKFQFNRLLEQIDRGIESGGITDDVFAQIGESDYKPRHFSSQPFLTREEFEEKIQQADVVISHVGVGAVMAALQKEKPVIMFPRLSKYHEHVDDHQTEVARVFGEKGYALLCGENDDLSVLLAEARNHLFNKYISQTDNIVNLIEDFLKGEKAPGKRQ